MERKEAIAGKPMLSNPERIQRIHAQLYQTEPADDRELLPTPTLRAQIDAILERLGESEAPRPAAAALLPELQKLLQQLGKPEVPSTLLAAARELRQIIGEASSSSPAPPRSVSQRLHDLLSLLVRQENGTTTIGELLDQLEKTVGQPQEPRAPSAAGGAAQTSILDQLKHMQASTVEMSGQLKGWQEGFHAQLRILEQSVSTLRNASPERADTGVSSRITAGRPWLYILGGLNILLSICLLILVQVRHYRTESRAAPPAPMDGGVAGAKAATTEQAGPPVVQQCSPELKCPEFKCPEFKCSYPAPILGPIYVQPNPPDPLKEQRRESIPDAGTRGRPLIKP